MSEKKKTCQGSPRGAVKAKLEAVIKAIKAMMEKHKIPLADVHCAVAALVCQAVEWAIMKYRSEGKSIRAIARIVHMDEKRISAIIKSSRLCFPAKDQCKKPCKKSCKKPCKKSCGSKKR